MKRKILLLASILVIVFIAFMVIWLVRADALQKKTKEQVQAAKSCVLALGDETFLLDESQLGQARRTLLTGWSLDIFYQGRKEPSAYLVFDNMTLGLIYDSNQTYLKVMSHTGRYFRMDEGVYLAITQLRRKSQDNIIETYEKASLSEAEQRELWSQYIRFALPELPSFEAATDLYSGQILDTVLSALLDQPEHGVIFERGEQTGESGTLYLPEEAVALSVEKIFRMDEFLDDGTVFHEARDGVSYYAVSGIDSVEQRKARALPEKIEDSAYRIKEVRMQGGLSVIVLEEYAEDGESLKSTWYCAFMKENNEFYLYACSQERPQVEDVRVTGDYQPVGRIAGQDFYEMPASGSVLQIDDVLLYCSSDGYKIILGGVKTDGSGSNSARVDLLPRERLLRGEKKGNSAVLLTNQRVIAIDKTLKLTQIISLPEDVSLQYDVSDGLKEFIYIDDNGLWHLSGETGEKTQIYKQPYQYGASSARVTIEQPRFVWEGQIACIRMESGLQKGCYLFDEQGDEEFFPLPRTANSVVVHNDQMIAAIDPTNGTGQALSFVTRNLTGVALPTNGLLGESICAGEHYLVFFAKVGKGYVLKSAPIVSGEIREASAENYGVLNASVKLFGVGTGKDVLCGYYNLGEYGIVLAGEE